MELRVKQSDPRAVFRRVYFTCVDAADLQARLQASDMATFVVRLSKNGGSASAASAATPVEIDATHAKGLFYVELALADINTAGTIALVVTNTGGSLSMEPREIVIAIDAAYFATALSGPLTAASFLTDRTETAIDFWKGALVLALTGSLAGQVKKIGAYSADRVITLSTGVSFTAAPANGDIFELVNR